MFETFYHDRAIFSGDNRPAIFFFLLSLTLFQTRFYVSKSCDLYTAAAGLGSPASLFDFYPIILDQVCEFGHLDEPAENC